MRLKNEQLQNRVKKLYEQGRLRDKRFFEASKIKLGMHLGSSPNIRLDLENKPIRDRVRYMYENDGHARRAVDSYVCNIVGDGVIPIAKSSNPKLEESVSKYLARMMATTDLDYYKIQNLPAMQASAIKACIMDGNSLLRRIRGHKLTVQSLEIDYLDSSKNMIHPKTKNEIWNGIEYDKVTHKRKAYWLFQHHPEENFGYRGVGSLGLGGSTSRFDSIRIPADDIIHVRRVDRPGQQLGNSWLSPILTTLVDIKEYEEAKLYQQKLQACYTAFIEDNFTLSLDAQDDLIGLEDEDDEATNPLGRQGPKISPGYFEELPRGKKVVFPTPSPSSDESFVTRGLRSSAGGMGISYEVFNDYSNVSFSSGRMGFLEMDRNLKHHMRTIFEPQLLHPLSNWILHHLEINGVLPENHDVTISWTPPAREMVDPVSESNALANMVGQNLMSHREALAIRGKDFEQVVKDIKLSNDYLEKSGLSPLTVFAGSPTTEDVMLEETGKTEDNGEEDRGRTGSKANKTRTKSTKNGVRETRSQNSQKLI